MTITEIPIPDMKCPFCNSKMVGIAGSRKCINFGCGAIEAR